MIMKATILLLALLYVALGQIVIKTPSGSVMGVSGDTVNSFLGLRYAQAPVGDLRWKSPVPYPAWVDTYNATAFGHTCWQPPSLFFEVGLTENMDEDCLFLNVYSPVSSSSGPVPVKIWIHGGGYFEGAGSIYPGASLAEATDSVVVTINYRLGVFGFIALSELSDESPSLNYGLLDQQLALAWVQANIAAFGGDPTNVMLMGESAGGESLIYHLLMEDSFPHYQKVAIQSAGPWIALPCSIQESAIVIPQYVIPLDCNGTNTLQCMRGISAAQLLSKFATPLVPCIDNSLIKGTPYSLIKSGDYNQKVPVLIGHNENEGQQIILYLFNKIGQNVWFADQDDYVSTINSIFSNDTAPMIQSLYQNSVLYQGYYRTLVSIFSDFYFQCGAVSVADIISTTNPVFFYYFVHDPYQWDWTALGATHMAEIAYLFTDPTFQNHFWTEQEETLSAMMTDLWDSFHTTGNPGNAFPWPQYSSDGEVLVLDINLYTAPRNSTIWSQCPNLIPIYQRGY